MRYTISALAKALSARLEGDGSLEITGAAEPAGAGPEDLALAMQPAYAEGLTQGQARVAILWEGADWRALGLEAALFVARPRFAMAHLTARLDAGPEIEPGVHSTAIIHPSAEIGDGAAIGPFVVIGRGVRIGQNARIASHCSIAEEARIGDDVLLHSGARIGARVVIGDRFIGQPGCVIGADGLSFVTPEKSGVEKARESLGDQGEIVAQSWTRIHSLGSVRIGDDVELGASTCVDRGTIRDTVVGRGCKIDNLCHIAHNVVMGEDCLCAAQTGIAGSTRLGDRVICGGQTGIADNLTVGSDVIFGGGTKVLSKVPAGQVMLGYPAVKMATHVDMYKAMRRLPRVMNRLFAAEKAVPKSDGDD
ncbi:UDP-3-O-(3-hydroxymyristoyl)glucosamine N-acyltransferase [Palleronia caenipelagi]|uniref:UDP-3-O-(3-hydroxymyristoyl)glucosamine N-acyltransferase n=1 Tax=Palleronia caenipelagi TaxID=2489174 RepID=A0A547QAM3_9RHOB|nr:UDP-3-O-(3-hydroxymyristoyl)glucosamine N-acyltransferase [Palleronia caenipelagi]TRD23445.1 UDP-3-O-(3-hydroxymyristoyl)glucosamine N-acyltransferase [Palleronia caenipelagi]